MDTFTYKGHIDKYLKAPLYMVVVFAAGAAVLFFYNFKLGFVAALTTVIYGLVIGAVYRINKRKLSREIINFDTRYGTVQRELLKNFEIPYALLDASGRFLWENDAFRELAGDECGYQKSITTLFGEINGDLLRKTDERIVSLKLAYKDRTYRVTVQKLVIGRSGDTEEAKALNLQADRVIAVMMFDQTDYDMLQQQNRDQQLVAGLVYIDNYEETMESLESVKRSMMTAIIDRKINKYFQAYDAVVRKIERDKYFVVFQRQYLAKMEENKFSLLEDVRTSKLANGTDVTLSIGIGLGGSGYVQDAEYSRTAIDIALGRGGAQAVVKDAGNVSYYGSRGKEVEKTTRVKARVKAQALREIMATRDRILVMGHQLSDIDAFGSAVGIYVAARELGKEAQIVLDTITTSLRPFVDLFTEKNGYPEDMIIDNEMAMSLCDSHTLVVVVDTNRPSYTECPDLLKVSNHIVVFDHHRQGDEVVQNPVLSYIEPYASSACEMIAEVLQYFSEKVELHPQEADCIYAGILIDTDNFVTKTGVRTFEAAAYLRRNGADVTRVRKLLREDMNTYKARAEVVRHAQVYRGAFAISVCDADGLESPTIVGAQAANELLNIVGIKASFVLTKYNNRIYVSSRSIDEIDVQVIMERLGGGGHLNIAGAQVDGASIDEVKQRIMDIIDDMIDEGEIKL